MKFAERFSAALTSVQYPYLFCHVMTAIFIIDRYNFLELFINSFLGKISYIWASIPLTLKKKLLMKDDLNFANFYSGRLLKRTDYKTLLFFVVKT